MTRLHVFEYRKRKKGKILSPGWRLGALRNGKGETILNVVFSGIGGEEKASSKQDNATPYWPERERAPKRLVGGGGTENGEKGK